MLYFSGSYTNYLHHFVIQNMPNNTSHKKTTSAEIAGILKNILTRSMQVKPSNRLLPVLDASMQSHYPDFLPKNNNKPIWNVANFDLFYQKSEQILQDYDFCKNMFCSSFVIADLIDDSSTMPITAYLPVAKLGILVVEHDVNHAYLDPFIPKLQKAGIVLLCISKHSLTNQTSDFDSFCTQIQLHLSAQKESIHRYQNTTMPTKEQLLPVIIYRFQILVLCLLQQGTLDFKNPWKFNIYCEEASNFGQLALDDLWSYIASIAVLCNESIAMPSIQLNQSTKKAKKEGWINVAISTTTLWDFSKEGNPFIWIASDYLQDTKMYLPTKYTHKTVPHTLRYFPVLSPEHLVEDALLFLMNLFFDVPVFNESTLLLLICMLTHSSCIATQKQDMQFLQSTLVASTLHAKTTIIICANQSTLIEKANMLAQLHISKDQLFILEQTPFLQADIDTIKKIKPHFLLMTSDLFYNAIFLKFYENIVNYLPIFYIILDEIEAISTFSERFCMDYFWCCKKITDIALPAPILAFSDVLSQNTLQDCCNQLYFDSSNVIAYPIENHLRLCDAKQSALPLNSSCFSANLELLLPHLQKILPLLTNDNFRKYITFSVNCNDISIKELLYFLSIMGIIEDWYFNIDKKDTNNLIYSVKISPFHSLSIQKNIQTFITLHDTTATIVNFMPINESSPIVCYFKAFLIWIHTKKITQEEFQKIEISNIVEKQNLLRNDNQTSCPSLIQTDNYYLLYGLFYDTIDLQELLKLLDTIQTQKLNAHQFTLYKIVSFLILHKPHAPCICLLYGLLTLLLNEYNMLHDAVYFRTAFEYLTNEIEFDFLDDILKIASLLPVESKDIISEYLCNYFPSKIEIIYKYLNDNVSLQHILMATANKILKLGEQFNDKCR